MATEPPPPRPPRPSPLSYLDAPGVEDLVRSGRAEEAAEALTSLRGRERTLEQIAAIDYAEAQLDLRQLRPEAAAGHLTSAAERFGRARMSGEATLCELEKAQALGFSHHLEAARKVLSQAQEQLRQPGVSSEVAARCHLAAGSVARLSGHLVESLHAFYTSLSCRPLSIQGLLGLGTTLRLLAQHDGALPPIEQARQRARQAGDTFSESIALGQLALSALDQEDLEQAHGFATRQLALSRSLDEKEGEARARVVLAEVLLRQGRAENALLVARDGLAASHGDAGTLTVFAELIMARALLGLGRSAEAQMACRKAAQVLAARSIPDAYTLERATQALVSAHEGDAAGVRRADAQACAAMRLAPVARTAWAVFGMLAEGFERVGLTALAADRRRRAEWVSAEVIHQGREHLADMDGAPFDVQRCAGARLFLASRLTQALRALSYDEQPREALAVLMRCPLKQRDALRLAVDRVNGASAGQLGSLLAVVLDPAAPARGGVPAEDERLSTLGRVSEVLSVAPVKVRCLLAYTGELILDSASWAELLSAAR